MLVLTRKRDQKILIGDGIRITILGIQTNQVRLGIEAPADVSILREELARRPGETATPDGVTRTEVVLHLDTMEMVTVSP